MIISILVSEMQKLKTRRHVHKHNMVLYKSQEFAEPSLNIKNRAFRSMVQERSVYMSVFGSLLLSVSNKHNFSGQHPDPDVSDGVYLPTILE